MGFTRLQLRCQWGCVTSWDLRGHLVFDIFHFWCLWALPLTFKPSLQPVFSPLEMKYSPASRFLPPLKLPALHLLLLKSGLLPTGFMNHPLWLLETHLEDGDPCDFRLHCLAIWIPSVYLIFLYHITPNIQAFTHPGGRDLDILRVPDASFCFPQGLGQGRHLGSAHYEDNRALGGKCRALRAKTRSPWPRPLCRSPPYYIIKIRIMDLVTKTKYKSPMKITLFLMSFLVWLKVYDILSLKKYKKLNCCTLMRFMCIFFPTKE